MSHTPAASPTASPRAALRTALLAQRRQRGEDLDTEARIAPHLRQILEMLEPEVLGVYWPVRLEFNPVRLLAGTAWAASAALALPWVQKNPQEMHYRRWDGRPPTLKDECGILASEGARVVPDVVLAPCVGYTEEGLRLGYGGGYFDRFLAAHPHVTAIGVAPAWAQVALAREAHDIPLPIIVTDAGVVAA